MRELAEVGRRARYAVGNVWRLASSPWLQTSVAPEECSSLFAASLGDTGWHHIRETLREYDRHPDIDWHATTMCRFLTEFRPSSMADLLPGFGGEPLPLFVYPWGTFRIGEVRSSKDPWTSRFCGPSTDEFVREEFHRTIAMYKAMAGTGYRPYRYPHSFVGGTFLEARDGRRRFVVLQGNHRVAILAHLGCRSIRVRPLRGYLWRVREVEAAEWPLVKSGRCSPAYAAAAFLMFFTLDGHHLMPGGACAG